MFRNRPMELAGKTAIVTGAGSGIGRAVAITLARHGCHLVLADLNEEGIAETESLAAGSGVRIGRYRLDVADAEAVADFPQRIAADHPCIDILVNNAGVALGGSFEQVSDADFEWLFSINFWGVVRMTRAFLPVLKASADARLVNLSSLFGLIAPPGQAAYVASKFAVRGFSEALRHELENTNIGVTVVHPGGVATAIAKNARRADGLPMQAALEQQKRFQHLLKMPPARAGEIIVAGIVNRRPRVIVGSDAKIAALLERLAPVSYWNLLKRRSL
jgi:NAD(P)-dependent dehydrogenase (short-subunit alcohol dehydrogenase family)